MKAAIHLAVGIMLSLGLSVAHAIEAHNHGANTKAETAQSLGGGKACEKCNKNKGDARMGKAESLGGGNACKDGKCGKAGKRGCCCAGMMAKRTDMMGDHGGMDMGHEGHNMDHDAMMDRMKKMEERMEMMHKMMMEQKAKS